MMEYDQIPFPDLTGLRTTAYDRQNAQTNIQTQRRFCSSTLQKLNEVVIKSDQKATYQDLIVAISLVILTHLLSPEDECRAQMAVWKQDEEKVTFSYLKSNRHSRRCMRLTSLIQNLHQQSNTQDISISANTGNAILFYDENRRNSRNSSEAVENTAFTLIVEPDGQGRLLLQARASPRHHTIQSANLQLDQIDALLKTICDARNQDDTPVFSTNNFDTKFLASDNNEALQSSRNLVSGDLQNERFEFQFEKMAKEHPTRIALEFRASLNGASNAEEKGNVLLNYFQVNLIASQVEHKIRNHAKFYKRTEEGHKIIALFLEKSHWTYIAIIAILKAGAAWCPIDTDWPSARRKALLAKSGASIVLSAGKNVKVALSEDLPKDMEMIDLDSIDDTEGTATQSHSSHRGGSSDDLAYVIWTSGTTGLPKAVGIQHKAAVQALRSLQDAIPHQDGKEIRFLQFSAYIFDLMILDMFYTWGLGGTLISSTRATLLTDLIEIANITQATHTLLTPAVMAMTPRKSIPSLKVVINGGEKLSQIVADLWSEDCCLLNLYGPAEATLIAMSRRVPANDVFKAPNIGRALQTVSCYVIDAEDNLVIKGAVGQLALGGHQCAIGYIGDKVKSDEKFQHHPALGRIYKTGDLVRQLYSEEFEYLGRADDQVKVNGIRIELLEINATIRSSVKEIKDSETLLVPLKETKSDATEAQIVSFSVVPSQGGNVTQLIRLDEEAIRVASASMEFAQANLPTYMVPSLFLIVNYFPKTSSAKVDREVLKAALSEIDVLDWQNKLASSNASSSNEGEKALKNEAIVKEKLAAIFLIDQGKIGRFTPFPQMGLDSIRAILLAKRLNQTGVKVSVVDILNHSTVEKLALRIQSNLAASLSQEDEARKALEEYDTTLRPAVTSLFGQSKIERILPCTPLQESLIAETLQDPARYWLHRVYSLPSHSDLTQVQKAVDKVVHQVEILRVVFVAKGTLDVKNTMPHTSFVQVVHKDAKVRVHETESSEEIDEEILALRSARLQRIEILGKGSPLGFTYLKRAGRLVMHIHHALYDQISLRMIDKCIDNAWGGETTKEIESFSKALPSIVDLDEKRFHKRKQAWEELLEWYPKGQINILPKLSMLEDEISESSIESRRLVSSIKYGNLAKKAQTFGTSARPLLQTALAFVLSRLCDVEQIMLGDVVSGRAISSHLDNVVGPVLATMVVPVAVCGNSTFEQVWNQVSQFHTRALPHAHFPLAQIKQILCLPRKSNLFHAVFAFEPPMEDSSLASSVRARGDYGIAVEHPLAIEMEVDQNGTLAILLNTKKGMVDTDMANVFLIQLESAIKQVLNRSECRLSSIELDNNLHTTSVSQFHIPESILQASQVPCFAQFFQLCNLVPQKIAIEYHESTDIPLRPYLMTYSELLQKSKELAQYLLAFIPSKSIVAVTLPRSFDTYVALLAILQAGYVYLPIDIALPNKRKELLFRESKARCLICHTSTAWMEGEGEKGEVQIICMNELTKQPIPHQLTTPKIDMQDPAYILFTSGSTGVPKGCVLSHENLSATLASFGQMYDDFAPGSFDNNARFLARSIESFDVALLESLLPLQYGATIVTAHRHVILTDLGKAMQKFEVTHAAVVPSLFYTEGRRVLPSDLPNLRALIVGGERLTKDILANWSSSPIPLLNAYGPTEACIGTSISKVRPSLSTGNVGKAFGSTKYVVLKKRSNENEWTVAMRGESGELCIGGLQVGHYLGKDKSDAFFEWQGQRFYRTGDEVFMWPDDSIEYLGRIHGDSQVKVRGVRIELAEIDHAVGEKERNTRSITLYLSHPSKKQLIVTFAASSASSTRADDIRQDDTVEGHQLTSRLLKRCRELLPSYMVPSMIIPLNYIPLATISGKDDVKRLTDWYSTKTEISKIQPEDRQNESDPNVRVLTDVEQIVQTQILRLFDMKQNSLRPSTDLFALGLDSLKIIALCGALQRLGLHIEISDAMSNPSIEGIGERCVKSQANERSEARDDITRWDHLTAAAQKAIGEAAKVQCALPCLPLQASMVSQTLLEYQQWQEGRCEDIEVRYVNISRYKATDIGPDQSERVEKAFQAILLRHTIYRTAFVEIDDQIVQAVLEDINVDGMHLKKDETWEKAAVQDLGEKIHCCPPLRYRITQEKESSDVYLDLVIHHAIYDGVSLHALLLELSNCFASNLGNTNFKSTDFGTVVRTIEQVKMTNRLQYWHKILNGCSINFFPCLTGYQPSQQSKNFDQFQASLKTSLSNIQAKAREKQATVAMLILHTFAELYSKYVGEADIIVGLVLNGRSSESEIVHGPCINTVPFRYQSQNEVEAIQQIRHSYAQALQHQHISLADLARYFKAPKGLFNTLFSFNGAANEKKQDTFQEVHSNLLTEYPFAIEVNVNSKEDKIEILISVDKAFVPLEQAEIFLAQLDFMLCNGEDIKDNATRSQKILSIENPDPDQVTLKHFSELFDEQAKFRAQDVAFAFVDDLLKPLQTCTYEELDRASDRIAFSLQKYPGSIVGVHMSQCAEIYPVLVGIWKARKAFLPLDPKLPSDRLEHILSVTNPSSVVVLDTTSSDHALFRMSNLIAFSEACSTVPIPKSDHFQSSSSLDDLAYIMFTSGSSGKPKGVEISHRALAAALRSWKEILPHTPGKSRMLQLASPGFDVFLIEVCMPLALGFSFASAPKEVLLDDLEKTFYRLHLTMADLPAALATTVYPSNLPPLEWLMSGGEQMDQRVIDAWSSTGLINAWGPTEATIGNTLGFVDRKRNRNWIGRAYPTSSIFVLQPDTKAILPRGCIGEIAIGGPQLANGYYGNPTLTAEKFINVNVPGHISREIRLYRTGDRGRILSNGSIECHGRIEGDGQVKINSQRVELGEIEIALKQQRGITNASVLYLAHPRNRSHQLVAFLTVETRLLNEVYHASDQLPLFENKQIAREISHRCLLNIARSLPAYMVPQHCFILASSSLPLTPNNKVDTRRLKSLYIGLEPKSFEGIKSFSQDARSEEPFTETEKHLVKLISEFVGVDESEIDLHTSLYRFGIDSISGLRLARFLRDRDVKGIRAHMIFSSPSIASIAASIEQGDIQSKKDSHDISITLPDELRHHLSQAGVCDLQAFPCTPLQNGMLLESLVNRGALYIHHQIFRLPTEQVQQAQKALEDLCNRHELLHSSFHLVDGEFVRVVRRDRNARANDLVIEPNEKELQMVRSIQERHRAVLMVEKGLEEGPFLSTIVKGKTYSYLILTLHHALYDAESLELLSEQFMQLTKGETVNHIDVEYRNILPSLLPSSKAADYWVQRIRQRQDSIIAKHSSQSLDSNSISFETKIRKNELEQYAKKMSVAVHTVAIYSFAKLLASITGQLCVTFAEIFSLRNGIDMEGIERIFGPCFNTILSFVDLRTSETTIEALHRLQSEIDHGRHNRNASLAEIQRGLIKNRGRPCKIDALFNMQVLLDHPIKKNSELVSLYELEDEEHTDHAQYALNVEFVQRGEKLSFLVKAHKTCFNKSQLSEFVKNLENILLITIKNPHASSIDMPSPLKSLKGFNTGKIKQEPIWPSKYFHTIEESVERKTHSPLQTLILDTIGTVLQTETGSIGIQTSLPGIGLDSIASMHLATRLRKNGIKIGVADIIQGKTVEGIISKVKLRRADFDSATPEESCQQTSGKERSRIISVAKQIGRSADEIEALVPVLPGQYFELIQSREEGIYTFAYRFGSGRKIDLSQLEKAWHKLRQRFSILRTTLLNLNGDGNSWDQVIFQNEKHFNTTIVSHKIQKPFMDAVEENGLDFLIQKIPIHLQPDRCPARIDVFCEPEGDILLLRLHHALYDAWSLPIMMEELGNLYEEREMGNVPNYIAYTRHVMQRREKLFDVAKNYWRKLLGDCQIPRIPIKPSGSPDSKDGKSFIFLRNALTNVHQREDRLKQCHGGLPALIMASWANVLMHICRPTRAKVSVFGLYISGRNETFDGIERMTGNLSNVVPVFASMKENNRCMYETSKTVLWRLAENIKVQLDEHRHLDSFTSIKDILAWTENEVIPWNSTLNLLWPRNDLSIEPKQEKQSTFTMIEDLLLKTNEKRNKINFNKFNESIDAFANVQIDIQLDPNSDAIHFGVKWDHALWSSEQVYKIMHDFCKMIETGSGDVKED